jgi:hypothetical protein
MGEPGAIMIPLVIYEYLGFILEPPEGGGMDDTVPVSLKFGPVGMLGFIIIAAARFARFQSVRSEIVSLKIFQFNPQHSITP